MSWYWYDADGYISDGPSSEGLFTLHDELDGPAAKELLEDGWTERLNDLSAELARVMSRLEKIDLDLPGDARAEISLLQETVQRASEILILTDGLGNDD